MKRILMLCLALVTPVGLIGGSMSEDKEEKHRIQDALSPFMYGFILGVFAVIIRHLFREETCGYFC